MMVANRVGSLCKIKLTFILKICILFFWPHQQHVEVPRLEVVEGCEVASALEAKLQSWAARGTAAPALGRKLPSE